MLGWVRSGKDENTADEQWSCSQCTLLNSNNRSNCSACHAPKKSITPKFASYSSKINTSVGQSCVKSGPLKRRATSPVLDQPQSKMTRKSLEVLSTQGRNNTVQGNCDQTTKTKKAIEIAKCSEHKCPCIMREVRKKSHNVGRMFWSCTSRNRCNFFQVRRQVMQFFCFKFTCLTFIQTMRVCF